MTDLVLFLLAALAIYVGFWAWPDCAQCRRMASRFHLERSGFTAWRLVFSCKSHRVRRLPSSGSPS